MDKIKFGLFLPFYAFQAKDSQQQFLKLREIALEAERLEYTSIWLDDHLMYNDWPILEPWTTISALSMLTTKIRIGTMVSCNQHRNPSLLAKTAATFDVLSNGRLEFGIGAGVQENEHLAYGFDFPKSSIRIERLDESLNVIKGLWSQEKTSYSGKHYALKDAVCVPKPLQKPHPPITVGGAGEKILTVTAKHANRFDWGFLPVNEYKRKLESLGVHCKTFGRDIGEMEKSCWPAGQILMAEDNKQLAEKIRRLKPANVSLEEFKQYTLAGNVDECRERLQSYIDLGATYFMLYFADLPHVDSLRLFTKVVEEL